MYNLCINMCIYIISYIYITYIQQFCGSNPAAVSASFGGSLALAVEFVAEASAWVLSKNGQFNGENIE